MVCVVGFEPTASWLQTRPSTRLTLHADKLGAADGNRTHLSLADNESPSQRATTALTWYPREVTLLRLRVISTVLYFLTKGAIYGAPSKIRTCGFTVLQTVALGLSAIGA